MFFDKIIFTSKVEMDIFKNNYPNSKSKFYSQIIPIAEDAKFEQNNVKDDIVFGYIGSDAVAQNKKTILYLHDLWIKNNIAHKLIIAGRMKSNYDPHDNIAIIGFVNNLNEFYDKIDVLIAPSFVPGGVKTKVIEAIAHCKHVIGNETTFAGLPIASNYPLILGNDELTKLLIMNSEYIHDRLIMSNQYMQQLKHEWSPKKLDEMLDDLFS